MSSKRNVIIIGQSGAGKSSLINMLSGEEKARTSPDTKRCTVVEKEYECDLGEGQSCRVHDTVGLEEGLLDFLWAPKVERQLKKYLKEKKPLHLLVYCISGVGLKKVDGRNFNKFKSAVGKVPVVMVITNLENFNDPNLENWWSTNRVLLRKLDIPESTSHVCVTTLPRAHLPHSLYNTSREAIRTLIRDNILTSR
jgi:predicted GTPase